jgi:hypothetical protein
MYKYKDEDGKAGCQVRDNGYYWRKKKIAEQACISGTRTSQTRSQATEGIKVPETWRGERET